MLFPLETVACSKSLLIHRFIHKAEWPPSHAELTCLLWGKRNALSGVCYFWYYLYAMCLQGYVKKNWKGNWIYLFKRKAFKNAEQMGVKVKMQFWSNSHYLGSTSLATQGKPCCLSFSFPWPLVVIRLETQVSVALIRIGKLDMECKGKRISH